MKVEKHTVPFNGKLQGSTVPAATLLKQASMDVTEKQSLNFKFKGVRRAKAIVQRQGHTQNPNSKLLWRIFPHKK